MSNVLKRVLKFLDIMLRKVIDVIDVLIVALLSGLIIARVYIYRPDLVFQVVGISIVMITIFILARD